MSAGILKALMQLFAIIARESGEEEPVLSGRDVVTAFLQQQLNQELIAKYLSVYDEFFEHYHQKKSGKKKKRTSLSSVKILRICTRINEELAQKEKYYVVIRLVEFIHALEDTNELEWEFVETVADTFNIPKETFTGIASLTEIKSKDDCIDDDRFMYVSNEDNKNLTNAHHMVSHGLGGILVFFQLENENMFFLRYLGNDDLFLNGQVLSAGMSYVFKQGASVRGNKINTIYYSDIIRRFLDDFQDSKIVFAAENVTHWFKRNNKQALHQLSLYEESGNLIGIMGASGSGKSTLLNVLNGNIQPTYGSVTINGVDIYSNSSQIEGVIGYVAQDDLLIEELSVFENLFYNAKLCFAGKTEEEITEIVDQTLQQLGLFEARELKVGSPLEKTISGGQRKRLNIALELIREPSVLFVDEPTSGLSSRDSENIMDLLKELTLRGKLVFVVIHQPSSDIFKMFDKLFILDQGGYSIYYGNPVESIIYFKRLVNHANLNESECVSCGNVNPEQIFNIIESKVVDEYGNITEHRKITPREWYNFYAMMIGFDVKPNEEPQETPKTSFSIPGRIKQFCVFFIRDLLAKLSNKQYILINALEAPLLAIVLSFFVKFYQSDSGSDVGYVFRESENLPQFIFISVIVALFLGLTVSAEEIIRDQKILKREKFLNLSKGSYLFSKITIMFIISAVQTFLYVAIGNTILEVQGMILPFWLIMFSTSCFANLLGLNISASFNSAKVIYILIPILIIPQLLFSGVIVKFDKLYPLFASQSGVPWIGNVMASRWAYEAMTVYQYKNNDYEKQFYDFDQKIKEYSWKKDFWVKELKSKSNDLQKRIEEGEDSQSIRYNIDLMHVEFEKIEEEVEGFQLRSIDDLTYDRINEDTFIEVDSALDLLEEYFRVNYKRASQRREKHLSSLTESKDDVEVLLAVRDNSHNDQMEEFVTNKNDMKKLVEYKGELVQKDNPIYLKPIHKPFFGAHFYAPSKNFFGKQITTFSANMMVIWMMTLFLTLILFIDGLRTLIESTSGFFERIFKKFKNVEEY